MSKVGLLDAAGNLVVEYSYDAWVNHIAVTACMVDTVGKLNSFRYRRYVWDEETGQYYLRSMYYIENSDIALWAIMKGRKI